MSNRPEPKIGQVWETVNGWRTATLKYVTKREVIWMDGNCYFSIERDKLKTLISDPEQPWLPLDDNYRLVTDEEMSKYKKPYCATFWSTGNDIWLTGSPKNSWSPNFVYKIPKNHIWEEDRKPEYKAFEID